MRKLFVFVLLCWSLIHAEAQTISLSFNDVSLSEALRTLNNATSRYEVNFIYNELEDFRVSTTIQEQTVPDAVRQVVGFYPMRICVADSLITVECTQKTERHLTGRLLDESGESLAYATIALYTPKDSTFLNGGVSNNSGVFVIPVEQLPVLARTSMIGYKEHWMLCETEDAGSIRMETESFELQGTTVTAERPQIVQTRSGSLVTNVAGTVLSKFGTAEDVLGRVPGLIKKQGGYEVFGKGTPIIYINGKKLQGLSELDRLSSADIKEVELITEPGADYDATVNAVVKIKTVKRQGDGLGVSYRQVYSQAHQHGLQEQLDINYRHRNLDLFGSLYYGLSHGRQEQRNDQKVNGGQTLELVEDLVIKSRNENFKGAVGFNYDINDKHSFGATYIGSVPTYSKAGWTTDMDVLRNGVKTDRISNIFDYSGKKRPTHDITAYYKGTIGKISIDWNGDAYFRKDGNTQTTHETGEITGSDRMLNTQYSADSRLYASKLVLTVPVWKGDLQIGSEYTNSHRKNVYQVDLEGDNLPTDSDDRIEESNIAAFASYLLKMNKLQITSGLRYEYVTSDYYDHGAFVAEQSRTYSNLLPHLSLSFPIKTVSATLNYNIKTRRPAYSILSSNVQYNDRYTYQSGNPLAKPSYIHTVAMNLSWRWVRFYANWRYTKDALYQCVVPYEKDNEITVFTYRNLPHYQTVASGVSLSPKFGCWSPILDMSLMYQDFSVDGRRYDKPLLFLKFNNAIQLPRGFILNIDMDYTSRGHSTTIEWAESGGLNIGVYKGFFKDRLSVNLQGRDLFASYRGSNWMRFGNREIYKWNYADTRMLVLTVRYRFNAAVSKYKGTGAGNDEKSRL